MTFPNEYNGIFRMNITVSWKAPGWERKYGCWVMPYCVLSLITLSQAAPAWTLPAHNRIHALHDGYEDENRSRCCVGCNRYYWRVASVLRMGFRLGRAANLPTRDLFSVCSSYPRAGGTEGLPLCADRLESAESCVNLLRASHTLNQRVPAMEFVLIKVHWEKYYFSQQEICSWYHFFTVPLRFSVVFLLTCRAPSPVEPSHG